MRISELVNRMIIPHSDEVYHPSDDSFLFLDYLDWPEFADDLEIMLSDKARKKESKTLRILDMGCGSGILGFCMLFRLFHLPDLTKITIDMMDINPKAIKNARELFEKNMQYLRQTAAGQDKNPLKVIKYSVSDLFENVTGEGKFDIVIFNPPYLPNEPELIDRNSRKPIDDAWDGGGESGNWVLLEFLRQLESHVSPNSMIYFIRSSLADGKALVNEVEKMGYSITMLSSIHIFFEDIILFRCIKNA